MRGTAQIVPMTRRHVDLLMPYEHDMFGTESWTRAGYLDELADRRLRHYLAAEDAVDTVDTVDAADDADEGAGGALLGWAGVMVVADEAQILTVGVVPAARRRGIARELVRRLLAEAVQRGAVVAYLEVRADNDGAIALYEAEGFVRIGVRRGYYDAGRIDALTMRRELSTG